MKNPRNYLLALLVLIALCNCSGNKKSKVKNSNTTSVSFEKTGEKTFFIDSLSNWLLLIPQTLVVDDKTLLLSLEYQTNTILVFDYETGRTIQRIPFTKEGPNSIKADVFGFQAFSEDSLLIVDSVGILYLTNFKGEIKKVINLDPDDIPGAPLLRANALGSFMEDDELLIDNYFVSQTDRLFKIAVNLQDASVNYRQKVPEEYIDGFWGVADFGYYTSVFNPKTREITYNFPPLDSLYIWNLEFTSLRKVYAGTQLFEHPIAKIFDLDVIPSPKEIEQKPLTRGIYGHIFYDREKDLYYRIIGLPISQTLLNSGDEVKSKKRRYAVIVLNSDFEILGEFPLPDYEYQIGTETTFLGKGGLYFQKESTNEDEAIFDVWSVVQ